MSLNAILLKITILVTCISSNLVISMEHEHEFEGDERDEASGSAIQMDIKFTIAAGKESDCYSHQISPGMVLISDHQVIQTVPGETLRIAFTVVDGTGQTLTDLGPRDSMEFKDYSLTGGWYHLCFHNDHDTVNDKEMLFYISTFKRDQWSNYNEELTELDLAIGNFTTHFSNVEALATVMLEILHYLRAREVADFGLLQSNNNNIYFWSIASCNLFIVVGGLQVYFVRKLFDQA